MRKKYFMFLKNVRPIKTIRTLFFYFLSSISFVLLRTRHSVEVWDGNIDWNNFYYLLHKNGLEIIYSFTFPSENKKYCLIFSVIFWATNKNLYRNICDLSERNIRPKEIFPRIFSSKSSTCWGSECPISARWYCDYKFKIRVSYSLYIKFHK